MSDLIVTTMNDLPGYRIVDVYGEVFGLTVRSRHIGSDIGASLKGLVGGEIKGYTKMLADSRLQAIERLRDAAREAGANAIIAMRFDSGAIGQWSEICAYGTAVWVQPVSDYAKEQHAAIQQQAGVLPHQQDYSTRAQGR